MTLQSYDEPVLHAALIQEIYKYKILNQTISQFINPDTLRKKKRILNFKFMNHIIS